jgi:hypothetical protein
MTIIKWGCFGIMLTGALATSLQLDPVLGVQLLFLGNAAWMCTAVYNRDWPSAANFAMLATVWLIGVVKHSII